MASTDVWAAHFGLTRTPFTKTIPADKLFCRAAHGEAIARIHYCINEAALGVVVGDTGAGKTVAVRATLATLDRIKFTLVYLANPSGGCRGLDVGIATALGATPRFHKADAINQAAALLATEQYERHRRVVFVIDDAHLLSTAEPDSASPFAAILLGQPTLTTDPLFTETQPPDSTATPTVYPEPSTTPHRRPHRRRRRQTLVDDARFKKAIAELTRT